MKHLLAYVKKEYQDNLMDYAILLLGGGFFLTFLGLYQGQETPSLIIVSFFVLFYIAWAVYHHVNQETFHVKNMLEYVLIGAVMLILTFVIFAYK